ncbi:unnamed protein product [Chrysoparadoxa australica]
MVKPIKAAPPVTPDMLPNRTPFEAQFEMFKRGMELTSMDDYAGAEKQWTEIIEAFETPAWKQSSYGNRYMLARAYANRGMARLALSRTREAILDHSYSIDLAPDHTEFWLNRGVAYEDMADRELMVENKDNSHADMFYQSALSDYDHALVLSPQDSEIYISRGDTLGLLRKPDEALGQFKRAVELDPNTPSYRAKLALAEIQCGHLDDGARQLKGILRRFPDFPEALLMAASCAWEMGDLSESVEMYDEALGLDGRLYDDKYVYLVLRWPSLPLNMLKNLRKAGTEDRLGSVRTLRGAKT